MSGTPKYISMGAEDLSAVQDLPEIAEKGTVILNAISYFDKGPKFALVNGKSITSVFGTAAFDKESKFNYHPIKFLEKWVGRGSSAFVERIIPDDANNVSNMVIYIDMLEDKVPNYVRDSFGNIVPGGLGDYKIDATTPLIDGVRIKLIKKFTSAVGELPSVGNLTPIEGTMTKLDENAAVVKSRMYPFMELRAKYQGSYYNNIGIGFNSYNDNEVDADLIKSMKSMLYGFKLYQRVNGSTTPKVTKTLADMQMLDVVLKPGVRNTNTSANVSLETIFSNSYYSEKKAPIKYKDVDNIFIYQDYLEFILGKIADNEKLHLSEDMKTWDDGEMEANLNWFDFNNADLVGDEYLINLFTGTATSGVPYYTLVLDTTVPAALAANTSIITFSNNTPVYLDGGSDGTMSLTDLHAKTSLILEEYNDLSSLRVNNIAYPGMFMVDSGYPLQVKKDMFYFITQRSETAILTSTEIITDLQKRRFNAANSIGISRALQARALLAPESTYFGTDCMRAACILGSFEMEDTIELIPNTYEISDYVSEMMGSLKWKPEKVFDKTCYGRHGIAYFPEAVPETMKDTYWKLGVIVPELTNRGVPKFLGLCTLYPNPTSVANNIFTMFALCNCERLAKDSWLDVGGDVTSNNAKFIELATKNLTKKHFGIFGGVFKTTIDVVLLERDLRNGNTYTVNTNLFGNVAKTGAYHSTKVYRQDAIVTEE